MAVNMQPVRLAHHEYVLSYCCGVCSEFHVLLTCIGMSSIITQPVVGISTDLCCVNVIALHCVAF